MAGSSPLGRPSASKDPRRPWDAICPPPQIAPCGAENFVEIEARAEEKIDFLGRFPLFAKGAPSADTLDDAMNALPAERFMACFTAWPESSHAAIGALCAAAKNAASVKKN